MRSPESVRGCRYRIAVGNTFREDWPGQTLRDDKGIVAERRKKLAQHLGLFGVLRHPIHFSLQLLGRDRLLPLLFEQLRIAQVILDLLFDCCLRHQRIERWLWIKTLFWPDAVTPVNVFDCLLIRDALGEAQGCVLVSVRAKNGVTSRRASLGRLLR